MPGGTNGDEAIKHVGKRRVRIAGRFFPNGSSAIDNTINQGKFGWSVAWTSTGLYTLTIKRRWMKLVPLGLGLQLATAGDTALQWGTFTANDAAGTWSVQIRALTAGSLANIAANAANSIGFELEAVQDTVAG
jgi:hypothetical protein